MKKLILTSSVIAFLGILALPAASQAATVAELQAMINALQAQIQQLQSQLTQIQGTTPTWCHTFWCHTFNVNLKIGDRGSEVEALQTVLERQGFSISSDEKNKKSFDESTASAVSGFQEKNKDEILTPLGLKFGTGFVGPSTRAKLNNLYGCGVSPIIAPIPPPLCLPVITVLSPNGGERWDIGKTYQIKWNIGRYPDDRVNIFLNNDKLWSNPVKITSVANSGIYNWTIPKSLFVDVPGSSQQGEVVIASDSNYKILLENATKPDWDFSNAPFSIVAAGAPSITVLSPNGGERWQVGSTQTIKWTSQNLPSGQLGIDLRLNDVHIRSLFPSTENDGVQQWVVPDVISSGVASGFKIRISLIEIGTGRTLYYDDSDAPFSIAAAGIPSITVLSPNGGERWAKGATQTIKWQFTPSACPEGAYCVAPFLDMPFFDIKLFGHGSCPAGTECPVPEYTIATNIRDTSHSWIVGNTRNDIVPDGAYIVKVCQGSICDDSNAPFSIVAPLITTNNCGRCSHIKRGIYVEWLAPDRQCESGLWYYNNRVETANSSCLCQRCSVIKSNTWVEWAPYYNVCETQNAYYQNRYERYEPTCPAVATSTSAVSPETQAASILSALRGVLSELGGLLR